MTDNISVKIVNLILTFEPESEKKDEKAYALYEIEPYQYGNSNCSQMKIYYDQKSDLDIFEKGKKYNIKLGKDKIFVDGNCLIINDADWNAQATWLQKVTDTTSDTTKKIGDTSADTVKKSGEGLKKAGDKLTESADNSKWPRWVLPIGIALGIILLIGIIAWIFKKK